MPGDKLGSHETDADLTVTSGKVRRSRKESSQAGLLAAWAAPRCGARAKSTGQPCQRPGEQPSGRCYLHGNRGGGPRGERHGNFKDGSRSIAAREHKAWIRQQTAALKELDLGPTLEVLERRMRDRVRPRLR